MIDENLKQWATPRQIEYIDAVNKHGSNQKAAKALGLSRRTVDRGINALTRNAALMGYSPDHDMTRTVPFGYKVKGVSTYYNAEGKAAGQWVKSTTNHEEQIALMEEMKASFFEDSPSIDPPNGPVFCMILARGS